MRFFVVAIAALLACSSIQAQESAVLPATDRAWQGVDYSTTYQILASKKEPLPNLSDERGALLLQRITSLDNLAFYREKRIPVQARFVDYIALQKSTASIMLLYYSTWLTKTQDLNTEMANLIAFSLYTSAVGIELADEIVPTLKQGAQYEQAMEGVRKMHSGLATQFMGAEVTLTENNGFSMSDRSIVLDAMARTLPLVKKVFSPEYLTELREKLKRDRRSFKAEDDLQRIDLMLREIGA